MTVKRPATHRPQLRWRTSRQLWHGLPAADLRFWLFDPASLTQRVREACTGKFSVRVKHQGWGRPRLDESRALGLCPTQYALIREVHLLCDDRPWVFARTVIPVSTLRGDQRRLAHLGSRPLGAVLFADPHMVRSPVQAAPIRFGHPLYAAAVQGLKAKPEVIWGRRSVFRLGGKPLLVSEFFLPEIGGCHT